MMMIDVLTPVRREIVWDKRTNKGHPDVVFINLYRMNNNNNGRGWSVNNYQLCCLISVVTDTQFGYGEGKDE